MIENYIVSKEEREEEYHKKWLDCSVTLREWQLNKIDLWKLMNDYDLDFDQFEIIRAKQFDLFVEYYNFLFVEYFKIPFDEITPMEYKIELANRDLELTASLIAGKVDDFEKVRISTFFKIEHWQDVNLQIDYILRGKYEDVDNFDIHNPHNYAKSYTILKYRSYLKEFLQSTKDTKISSLEEAISLPTKLTSNKQEYHSFKYLDYDIASQNLTDLFNQLKKLKLIKEDTKIATFRSVFSGKSINEKVVWNSNPSDFYTFISQLIKSDKIENLNQQHWKVADNCFTNKTLKQFDIKKIKTLKTTTKLEAIKKAINLL